MALITSTVGILNGVGHLSSLIELLSAIVSMHTYAILHLRTYSFLPAVHTV